MEGIGASFSKKLGPLPVYAWALLGVAAVLAYMYFTKSGFFAAASSSPTAPGAPGGSDGGLVSDMAIPASGAAIGSTSGAAGSLPWGGPRWGDAEAVSGAPGLGVPAGSSATPAGTTVTSPGPFGLGSLVSRPGGSGVVTGYDPGGGGTSITWKTAGAK